MVWSKIALKDNKPRYIKRIGKHVTTTKTRGRDALEEVPQGWEVVTLPNGELAAKPK